MKNPIYSPKCHSVENSQNITPIVTERLLNNFAYGFYYLISFYGVTM